MIKKLRRKFILLSMVSVFAVLFFTIGTINVVNYVSIENEAKDVLSEVIKEGMDDIGPGPHIEDKGRGNVDLRQEHYFIVSFNPDGTINSTNNTHMFMITLTECNNLATKVYKNELSGGKYGDYRYQKSIKADGLTYVGFVDIKERIDAFHRFLLLSSLISIGAFAILFVLILIGSKIVFKPSEEAYKNQKRFITNASHELKTPLTIISADLDLIEMDKGKDEWSESIRDQVNRLNEMTNQLVILSKLDEEDKNRFPFNDFSLNEVYKAAVDSFSPNFKKEGIKFSSHISSNITMFANSHLIQELIYIFLDNSLKYTGGDNKSSYFVISQNKNGKIEFRFSNTIDKDDEVDIRQMLDRFYRSPSNKKDGSGVGLSIAKEIIELHKGKIDIDKNNSTINFTIIFS